MIIETNLLKKPGIEVEPDYDGWLKNCRIRVTDVIPIPPICIEIVIDGTNYTFGTLGNFSLLIGKAKAGKTFALSLLLACAVVSGTPFQKLLRSNFPANKKTVLYFDTEQSKHHVHKVLKRICALSGIPEPDNIIVYSLRGYSPAERLQLVQFALSNTPNVGLAVIDGIRDLITSINDEEQACLITSKLLKWTEEFNVHIITVLHQNKGDLNARGHLGTELTNKSETTVSVCKATDNKNVSVLTAEFCRDKEFDPFAFQINEDGLPTILAEYSRPEGNAKSKKSTPPYEIPPETHKVILKDVFSIQSEMIRSELKRCATANISRWLGYDVGANKTDSWITHWLQFKHIITTGTPGTKACKYSVNSTGTINPTELT